MTPLEIQAILLKEVAIELHRSATLADAEWTEAFLQFCYDNRDSGQERFIVKCPAGRIYAELSNDGGNAMASINEIRPQLTNGDWWGIMIHITRDGKVDVTYDYDPDCIEKFIEDEEAQRPF